MDSAIIASLGSIALLVLAFIGGYQVGHKHGEAFALRLTKNKVKLNDWYRDEPKVEAAAGVVNQPVEERT